MWACLLLSLGLGRVLPLSGATIGGTLPLVTVLYQQTQKSLLDMEEEEEPVKKPAAREAEPAAVTPARRDAVPGRRAGAAREEEEEPAAPKPVNPDRVPQLLDPDAKPKAGHQAVLTCDILVASLGERNESKARPIRLLSQIIRPPFPTTREYAFQLLSADGKSVIPVKILGRNISAVRYFEEVVLDKAAAELGIERAELVRRRPKIEVASAEDAVRVLAAIAILQRGLAEHDSAVARHLRQGPEWTELRRPLANALFLLQWLLARDHFRSQRFQQATELADQLATDPHLGTEQKQALQELFEEMLVTAAESAFAAGERASARATLREYLTRYPQNPGAKAAELRRKLLAAAESLAQRALATNDPKLLDQAADVWPQLEGLDELRRKLHNEYPTLRIGYTALPTDFSPLTAKSIPERHAIGLLFESLLEWQEDKTAGDHYRTQLAASRPLPLARGRAFAIPHCLWSDSQDDAPHWCMAEDVNWTVQMWKRLKPFGLFHDTRQFVQRVDATFDDDPFRVAIHLEKDYWDPLSVMDFRILPKASFPGGGTREELAAFSHRPVGTGPFRLAESNDPRVVRFVANPLYRQPALPRIREITFNLLKPLEAQEEFNRGQLQMIADVPPEQVLQMRSQGKNVLRLPGRNLHFLAPNYAMPKLKNENLRLALAHGIDRQEIVTSVFRPGKAGTDHAVLNGPLPPSSWACNQSLPQYSVSKAQAFAAQAQQQLGGPLQVGLLFPDGDPATAQACEQIRKQLGAIGITMTTRAVEPETFFKLVAVDHQYELAYWRHDFEDESYWLAPLFDPDERGPGGANFMGYLPDPDMLREFGNLRNHKQFRTVQTIMQRIHEIVHYRASIIPLWQLDTYVAIDPALRDVSLDPFWLFRNVQSWSLAPR